jgi:ATP-dependent exoDNAse (exonuclease V) beta subunit
MVGDPKQAIYRFRRADLKTYLRARSAVETQFPGNVLQISANFRSGKSILQHVDRVFAERLGKQQGGYAPLQPTVVEDPSRTQSIAKLSYDVEPNSYVDSIRDREANAVAELCASLVGNMWVRRSNGEIARAEPGDIVLLAPRRTQLWKYERALEDKGLPVASQAGKNLYQRQEAQDFVALVRALADRRDTLALGALLRGPLVGLTERDLLDITQTLREEKPGAVFDLRADLSRIHHPVGRSVMQCLQELWRKRRSTTPYALLTEAVARLRVLPSTAGRSREQEDRSLGNINLLLERARSYDVRGLKQFAIDLGSDWADQAAADESPSDRQGHSIDIVTVHRAKGLEWPIVIPINFVTIFDSDETFFFRSSDNSVHWTLGDIISSTLDAALTAHRAEASDERERLLYVACTRALDLLVLPAPSWGPERGWSRFFDLGQAALEEIRLPAGHAPRAAPTTPENNQSAETFGAERDRIDKINTSIEWFRPSLADVDRELLDRISIDSALNEFVEDPEAIIVGAGARRGVILHKLMEELLIGLVAADLRHLVERAKVLVDETAVAGATAPDPAEMAAAALRTFSHRQLKPYLSNTVPEFPLFGAKSDTVLVAARADAFAFQAGIPTVVFDWKSDVAPTADDHDAYASQLLEYLELIGAEKGAVIYMTTGEVRWVHYRRQP